MCRIIDEMWLQCLKTPSYGNEKCILPWIWMNPLVSSCTLNSFVSSHINISSPQAANTYSPSFSLSRFLPFSRFRAPNPKDAVQLSTRGRIKKQPYRLLRCCSEVYICRRTVYTNLPFFDSRTVSESTPLSFCNEKSSSKTPLLPFHFPISHFPYPANSPFAPPLAIPGVKLYTCPPKSPS